MNSFCLEVQGDFACFTRPEMKVERVSYDVITPSAARAIFEAIFWKPAIRWQVTQIEVLNPIRWASVRRNEVGQVISTDNVKTAISRGEGDLGLYVEDNRQQRAALLLRDVRYRLHAAFELCDATQATSRFPPSNRKLGATANARPCRRLRPRKSTPPCSIVARPGANASTSPIWARVSFLAHSN